MARQRDHEEFEGLCGGSEAEGDLESVVGSGETTGLGEEKDVGGSEVYRGGLVQCG